MLVPVPVVVTPPGDRVRVQLPEDGSPESVTLPVGAAHDGWVTAPGTGGEGTTGRGLMTALAEAPETHPSALVTVK